MISGKDLEANDLEIVLGVHNGNKLNSENHIESVCIKGSQNLQVLQRISNLFDTQKKNLLCNSIIKSQFRFSSEQGL